MPKENLGLLYSGRTRGCTIILFLRKTKWRIHFTIMDRKALRTFGHARKHSAPISIFSLGAMNLTHGSTYSALLYHTVFIHVRCDRGVGLLGVIPSVVLNNFTIIFRSSVEPLIRQCAPKIAPKFPWATQHWGQNRSKNALNKSRSPQIQRNRK